MKDRIVKDTNKLLLDFKVFLTKPWEKGYHSVAMVSESS